MHFFQVSFGLFLSFIYLFFPKSGEGCLKHASLVVIVFRGWHLAVACIAFAGEFFSIIRPLNVVLSSLIIQA